MLNKKVFYTDNNYNFFVGIVKEVNNATYLVYTKSKGEWVPNTVDFYNVHELNLNNLKTLENKRFTLIKQKTNKIKRSISEINLKIISLSNAICLLEQERQSTTKDSYQLNKKLESLLVEKEEQTLLLDKFTRQYLETMHDTLFLKRINKIRDSLSQY